MFRYFKTVREIIRDGRDETSAVATEGLKMIEPARATNPQSEKNKPRPCTLLSHGICFAFDIYFPATP